MLIIAGVEVDEARLADICDRYGIAELQIFGSRARGTAGPDSDIDISNTAPRTAPGLEIEQLADELTALFGHPVNLVSLRSLHPLLQPSVLAEPGPSMQRDILLLAEMIDAAEQAQQLTDGVTVSELATDRQRRDALLWNFTVLGEAAAQLSAEVKARFPDIAWQQPARLRNRIVHGYWSIDLEVLHTTATEQLPGFTADLRTVLKTLPERA